MLWLHVLYFLLFSMQCLQVWKCLIHSYFNNFTVFKKKGSTIKTGYRWLHTFAHPLSSSSCIDNYCIVHIPSKKFKELFGWLCFFHFCTPLLLWIYSIITHVWLWKQTVPVIIDLSSSFTLILCIRQILISKENCIQTACFLKVQIK